MSLETHYSLTEYQWLPYVVTGEKRTTYKLHSKACDLTQRVFSPTLSTLARVLLQKAWRPQVGIFLETDICATEATAVGTTSGLPPSRVLCLLPDQLNGQKVDEAGPLVPPWL